MSLVFSAITPHPPLLIPTIGKEQVERVKQTQKAMEILEEDLYLTRPDLIIVISPHGSILSNAFTLNAHTNFVSAFDQFGDFTTKKHWLGSPHFAAVLAHKCNDMKISTQLISEEKLDHGITVPLYFLTNHLPDAKILPIGFSELNSKQHLDFGDHLKEAIMESDKRIAVIASGDLSHGLTTDAPAGYSDVGAEFDKKIIELLETRNTVGIAGLDKKFVEGAAECGYRSILILLGIMRNMDYTFKNYSYEGPFGVGYLVGNFVF